MFDKMLGYIKPILGKVIGVGGSFGNRDAAIAAAVLLAKEGHIEDTNDEKNAVATLLVQSGVINPSQCAQAMDNKAKTFDDKVWTHTKRGRKVLVIAEDLGGE